MINLTEINVTNIKGVGEKKAKLLKKLKIETIYDLLTYYPRDYENFSEVFKIRDKINSKGLFKVKVTSKPVVRLIRSNLKLTTINVKDDSMGAVLVFFNLPYFMQSYFTRGNELYIYGEVSKKNYEIQITNAEIVNNSKIGTFSPIYGLTAGLSNNEITKITKNALSSFSEKIIDYLPGQVKDKLILMDKYEAIENIHFPKSIDLYNSARRRLAFDEIFFLQGVLKSQNFRSDSKNSKNILIDNDLLNNFYENLPFSLTGAQKRVLDEIFIDFKNQNMNRLVQGDVGSGKTVIAAICLLIASINGYQSAIMAPTEILAKQHFETIKKFLKSYDLDIRLLIGSTLNKEKQTIYDDLESGKIDIIVGTHSLIQESVVFNNLVLTIVDEQHRFGVEQRKALYNKGDHPYNLSMTATPIPRSLALILYSEMDISVIDELPPGRKEIDTSVINYSYIDRLDKFVIKQIKEGRQVYVVCPLIDESDMPLKSLEEVFSHYNSSNFLDENISTCALHGKMKSSEKEKIMQDFKERKYDIIVSTTVIEVGVDVPNANLMIIYDADRFGLAQLHQLRGRVGRGEHKSYCVLITNNNSEISYNRLQIMKESTDGFFIANKDLEFRGQGELLGTRQHGINDLYFIDLNKDLKMIKYIQDNYDRIFNEINRYDELENEYKTSISYLTRDSK